MEWFPTCEALVWIVIANECSIAILTMTNEDDNEELVPGKLETAFVNEVRISCFSSSYLIMQYIIQNYCITLSKSLTIR